MSMAAVAVWTAPDIKKACKNNKEKKFVGVVSPQLRSQRLRLNVAY
jgi:hypothetical protein